MIAFARDRLRLRPLSAAGVGRAALVCGWMAALIAVVDTPEFQELAPLYLIGSGLVIGVTAGRWWVALLPLALASGIAGSGAVDDPDKLDEIPAFGVIGIVALDFLAVALPLLVGVGLRRLWELLGP
jgi:hypothetical protein